MMPNFLLFIIYTYTKYVNADLNGTNPYAMCSNTFFNHA